MVLISAPWRGNSLKSLSNANISLKWRWERNIWMCKKANQPRTMSEIMASEKEKVDTSSSCSLVYEGLGMRDQCIENHPHSACKASIVGGELRGKKEINKMHKKKSPTNPFPPKKKPQTKTPKPHPQTPYYMPIPGACQVLTKFKLACRPRILDLIRSLNIFVLGALAFFWETRF